MIFDFYKILFSDINHFMKKMNKFIKVHLTFSLIKIPEVQLNNLTYLLFIIWCGLMNLNAGNNQKIDTDLFNKTV